METSLETWCVQNCRVDACACIPRTVSLQQQNLNVPLILCWDGS